MKIFPIKILYTFLVSPSLWLHFQSANPSWSPNNIPWLWQMTTLYHALCPFSRDIISVMCQFIVQYLKHSVIFSSVRKHVVTVAARCKILRLFAGPGTQICHRQWTEVNTAVWWDTQCRLGYFSGPISRPKYPITS
jgi:hypothetical protein